MTMSRLPVSWVLVGMITMKGSRSGQSGAWTITTSPDCSTETVMKFMDSWP